MPGARVGRNLPCSVVHASAIAIAKAREIQYKGKGKGWGNYEKEKSLCVIERYNDSDVTFRMREQFQWEQFQWGQLYSEGAVGGLYEKCRHFRWWNFGYDY